MRKNKRILTSLLAVILVFTMVPLSVMAAETYGYEVLVEPSTVAIGEEVTLTFRLTDYTEAKSGIRGFQIDITDVDDVLHNAVCTALVTDTEDLLSNTAKYQKNRDIVRHAYVKMSGAMSYEDATLLEVKLSIPETYTEAGTLSLPLKVLIQNEAGDKITYTDTIDIPYSPDGSNPEQPDPEVVSVDITWGALSYTYTDGTWNAQSHTYSGAGWLDNDTGFVTVSNTGKVDTAAEFVFVSDRNEISGSFTDGETSVTEPVALSAGKSQKVYLTLSGKPSEDLSNTTIGTVTIKIGGE